MTDSKLVLSIGDHSLQQLEVQLVVIQETPTMLGTPYGLYSYAL